MPLAAMLQSAPLLALKHISWLKSPRMHKTWTPNRYPLTRRSEHVDAYQSASQGEVIVPDPYQWLETNSEETNRWTEAQNAFTSEYLDRNPDLERLRTALQECINYPKFSPPRLHPDGRWYWYCTNGLDPQMTLYRSPDRTLPDVSNMKVSDFEVFFCPNALSSDGTVSIMSHTMSKCGKYWAYGLSQSGSDFWTIYIRHTNLPFTNGMDHNNDPGRLLEEIKCAKFSCHQWSPDSAGLFYKRFPERTICYHRLGTLQSADITVHEDNQHPNWNYSIEVSNDGKYLVLTTTKGGQSNLLWVSELRPETIGPKIKWTKLVNEFNAEYNFITNIGSILYIRTNLLAPRYKIITFDLNKPAFRDLIPMTDATLSFAILVACDKLVLTYKRNVIDEIYIYSLNGEMICRVADESVGSTRAIGQEQHPWLFIEMTGFTTPKTIGLYDFSAPDHQRWSIYRRTVLKGLNSDEFEVRQVWYNSRDGTKIPMSIVRHKSTRFDGTAPVLQFGLGGFNLSVDPFFQATTLTFLKNYGAVYAVPNIRGGGEFGKEWHLAGCREKKSNCFDDFIAATEYLVKNKYADPNKVAVVGDWHGGLLVAACLNRAPEGTFRCAVAISGLYDMLKISDTGPLTGPSSISRMQNLLQRAKIHGLRRCTVDVFRHLTVTLGRRQNQNIGVIRRYRRRQLEGNSNDWTNDYGDPRNPNDFDFIYRISPIQNVPEGKVLPACLLVTGDHDDYVPPMHSFKMMATLQHSTAHNPHPLLLRINKEVDHVIAREQGFNADKFGFIVQSLGLEWKDKPPHHL